jgi:hypothetical protein
VSNNEKFILSCISCAILAITTGCRNASAPIGADEGAACRQFAQSFYDWYVPLTQKEGSGLPWNVVLERKGDVLAPDLFQGLKVDSDAQAQAKGDLVGIDFDPFVGSQDPSDRYEARRVTWTGDRCSVEVWPASPADTAEKTTKPDVIAELAREKGRWRFHNFRYPELKSDLLGVLAQLREDRRSPESHAEKRK